MAESPFGGLDLLPSSVVLLDGDFAIRYMNPAAESLLGTSDSAAHGSSLEAVAGCPATLVEAMHNALAHGYFKIDLPIVWKIIQADLPQLHALVMGVHPARGGPHP